MTQDNAVTQYPSPTYFLGALATDGAPMRLSVKLAQGYAAALRDLDGDELYEWCKAVYQKCVSNKWHEAAIAIICTESEERRPYYEKRAEKYLSRVGQKEA